MKNFLLFFTLLFVGVSFTAFAQCDALTINSISTDGADCPSSGSATVNASGTGLSYKLVAGPTGYPTSTNSTGIFNSLTAGTYTVSVTDNCGTETTQVFTISDDYPTYSVSSAGVVNGTRCQSGNPYGADLTGPSREEGPYQYDFVQVGTTPTYSTPTSATNYTETVTEAGVYRFYAMDACGEVRTRDVSLLAPIIPVTGLFGGGIKQTPLCDVQVAGYDPARVNIQMRDAGGNPINWNQLLGGVFEIWSTDDEITEMGMCGATPKSLLTTINLPSWASGFTQGLDVPQVDHIIIFKPTCGDPVQLCVNFEGMPNLDTYKISVVSGSCGGAYSDQIYSVYTYFTPLNPPINVTIKDKNGTVIQTGTVNSNHQYLDNIPHSAFPITVVATDDCEYTGTKTINLPSSGDGEPITANIGQSHRCISEEGTTGLTLRITSGDIPGLKDAEVTITGGPVWASPGINGDNWNYWQYDIWGIVPGYTYTVTWTNSCGESYSYEFEAPFNVNTPALEYNLTATVDALCGQNKANIVMNHNSNLQTSYFANARYYLVNKATGDSLETTNGIYENVPPGEYTAKWGLDWSGFKGETCPTEVLQDSVDVTVLGDGVGQSIIRKTILICEDETGNPTETGKAILEVNGAPPFTFEIIKKDVLDADPTTTAWVTSISGTSNPTYTWDLPLPGDPFDTEYVLRSVDKCDNKVTTQASLQPMVPPTFESESLPCVGTMNYNMSIEPYGGEFTYKWVKLPNLDDVLSTTTSLTLGGAYNESYDGTYRVYVILDGCIERYIDRTLSGTKPTFSISGDSLCVGDTLSLSASGGVSYQWTGPNGFTSTEANPTIEGVTLANSGTYTISVTNADNCTLTSDTTVVVEECIVPVFDLALKKTLKDLPKGSTVTIGDDVTFTLEVINQGTVDATDISLTDYVPSGLTLNDADWTGSGATATLNTPIAALAAGASTTVDITFTVISAGTLRNYAEISSAANAEGLEDIDSTPDSNDGNDGTAVDDEVDQSGKDGEDEDDHDYEEIVSGAAPVFDLALKKTLKDLPKGSTVTIGDDVTFTLEVINQGTVDATDISLTDYVPSGLTLNDADWTGSGATATLNTPIAALAAGASTTVDITFTVISAGTLRNYAEISSAANAEGLEDIDSTPDSNDGNDGTAVDDEVDQSGKDGEDEDDHDYEEIVSGAAPVFDLALKKTLKDLPKGSTVTIGDDVTFTLEVINQGTVDATDISLTDYVPSGLTLNDADWTGSGATATLNTPIAALAAGASTTVDITFTVISAGTLRNYAEISSAANAEGLEDIDSTPDSNDGNDGTAVDDEVDQSGKDGEDEDDHDYEEIVSGAAPVFDLALKKTLKDLPKGSTVTIGDDVTFTLEVINQGTVDATDISLTDYVPSGLTLNDADWTGSGATATLNTPIAALAAGASTTVDITFTVISAGTLRNYAEISSAANAEGLEDIDSTPDSNDGNDGTAVDDEVDQSGKDGEDEDDHDYEEIVSGAAPVFDLALKKTLKDLPKGSTVTIGDDVTFTLEVINQGTVDATDISLTDYVPSGLTLNDADWTGSGATATLNTPIAALAAGASTTVDITFTVISAGTLRNYAEISSATNAEGLEDIDSTPDSNDGNDGTAVDDEVDQSGKDGEDEDDHDYEEIVSGAAPVFDLALKKTLKDLPKGSTVTIGDDVTFTLEVINQGTVDATDISLTDYVPAGLTLNDADWTASGATATLNTPIAALAAGASTTVDITFTVSAAAAGSITNYGEISSATNSEGLPDIDSTPDGNGGNDGTPKDDVVDEDGKNGGDEDDHDLETIQVTPAPIFDLALTKTLKDLPKGSTITIGDDVTFTFTVINQGTVDATNIGLTDYVPAGLTLNDADWTASGATATLNTPIAALAAGASTTVDITFTVSAAAAGSITNYGEISSATNSEGLPDIDSTPDGNGGNDGTPKDDVVDEDGKNGGDEDDHDLETIQVTPAPIFDLALTKTLKDLPKGSTITIGDDVTFTFTVINQGTVDATNIGLTDYVPAGLTLNDADWTASGATATLNTPIAALAAGASTTVDITFTVSAEAAGSITNYGEISSATNSEGLPDIDSTPDGNGGNDGTPKDDVVDEDGKNGGDEDDHDLETIQVTPAPIFDLALTKTLKDLPKGSTITIGDDVTFTFTVINQGTVDATNIGLTDYVPAGLTLNDADWTASGATATLNTPIAALAAGASTTVDITFTVSAAAAGSITNYGEISSATNSEGLPDIDSTPDGNGGNDGTPKDDVVDEDGKNGGDEDDHDLETIQVTPVPVFDLALRKVMASGSKTIYKVGDEITFDLEVINQGTVDAANISLVDYIPTGLTLSDADWTASGTTATLNTPIAGLAAGASTTIQITFVVNASATGTIINAAEISGASGGEDIDSTPDGNGGNDGTPKNDEVGEDGKNGGDEDDHDIEPVTICPNQTCLTAKTTKIK